MLLLFRVRTEMSASPSQFPWNSHPVMMAEAPAPAQLVVDGLLSLFGAIPEEGGRSDLHPAVPNHVYCGRSMRQIQEQE